MGFLTALIEVILPVVAAWKPPWVILSAGFDGHRRDPITDLGLSSADYADISLVLTDLVPPGRRLLFLEGGYDLEALSPVSYTHLTLPTIYPV